MTLAKKSRYKGKKGLLVVISGPSGVGKSTVVKKLLKDYPELVFSISASTRKPRPFEDHGKDYFFLSEEDFFSKVKNDEFLEWAQVHGSYYGTPKDFVKGNLEKGSVVISEVDVLGAASIKAHFSKNAFGGANIVFIFLIPPSVDVLAFRLKRRKTEEQKQVDWRLRAAISELQVMEKYDYIVVNDKVDSAAEKINAIIKVEKERILVN